MTFTTKAIATVATVAAIALASTASAQSQSTNTTASNESYSGAAVNQYSNGSHIAPSVGSQRGNTTAECVNDWGFSIAGITNGLPLGVGIGIPVTNKACQTRLEAVMLAAIADMSPAKKRVVITHLCINSPTMRKTMESVGWCKVKRR